MSEAHKIAQKNTFNDYFVTEQKRLWLAKHKKYKEFIETYSDESFRVKDMNSSGFWDILNKTSRLKKSENPMAYDRIKIVSGLIRGNNKKVLDIGFGSAFLEYEWKRKYGNKISVYGIDISRKSVERASRVFKNWFFDEGDIVTVNLPKDSFDYVIALEVLEHIRPNFLFRALKNIKRSLKKDGLFIVSVPLNENLEEMLSEGRNPNAHLRKYEPEIIEAELKIVDIKVIKKIFLFAFHKHYLLKTFLARIFLTWPKKPNNIILIAQKK